MHLLEHEDAFPPTTLSIRSRLGKPTHEGARDLTRDIAKTEAYSLGSNGRRNTLKEKLR